MKHGDKAKAKTAKAASKTSGKGSKAVAAKTSSKTGKSLSSSKQDHSKAPAKTSIVKPAGGNGKSKGRGPADALGFTNPVVASAFKRAIKKFPTAFRRLTD
ncbi:MAG: hypothetical protein ACXW3E_15145 [Thermoanaerobaculia bacterium]